MGSIFENRLLRRALFYGWKQRPYECIHKMKVNTKLRENLTLSPQNENIWELTITLLGMWIIRWLISIRTSHLWYDMSWIVSISWSWACERWKEICCYFPTLQFRVSTHRSGLRFNAIRLLEEKKKCSKARIVSVPLNMFVYLM